MKILKNINGYWPTHYGALRLFVAAAPVASMALALVSGVHVPGVHVPGVPGSHWLEGSHWN
jgi:hypothetical protein